MKPTGTDPAVFLRGSADGQLLIGGICRRGAASPRPAARPLFVYDNNIVGAQLARFRAAMPDGLAHIIIP